MSLYHAKRYAMSFVGNVDQADIPVNNLTLGDDYVHFDPSIDDKSSSIRHFRPDARNPAHLAQAPAGPAAAGPALRPRAARCRPVLERHRLRGRKAVLAGLNAARPASPLKGDAGHDF